MKRKILFNKKDYKILIVGLIFIAGVFILMSGGGSDDPNIFNDEIYNFRRIRLSPTRELNFFTPKATPQHQG